MWRYAFNSTLYAILSTIGVVVSSVPVAYALSRLQWRGRQATFLVVLATLMLPAQVTVVPLYIVFTKPEYEIEREPIRRGPDGRFTIFDSNGDRSGLVMRAFGTARSK